MAKKGHGKRVRKSTRAGYRQAGYSTSETRGAMRRARKHLKRVTTPDLKKRGLF